MHEVLGGWPNDDEFAQDSDIDYSDDDDNDGPLLPGISSQINEFDSAFGIYRPSEQPPREEYQHE